MEGPGESAEAQPETGLVTCATHGLRYDPNINIGCVLCRRQAEGPARVVVAPTVRYGIVTGLLALLVAAGVFYVTTTTFDDGGFQTPAAMIAGSSSKYASCYTKCADAHHTCDERCTERSQDPACRDYCFSRATECFPECGARFEKPDPPWSYYYGSRDMPEWSLVLQRSVGVRTRLLECSEGPLPVLAYVAVDGDTGSVSDLAVWKNEMSDEVYGCVRSALEATTFASGGDDYAFLATFDSRYDGLHLLVAQLDAEIDALPRLVEGPSDESLKSRLFETKVLIEKQRNEPPAPEHEQLAATKEQIKRTKELLRQRSKLAEKRVWEEKKATAAVKREAEEEARRRKRELAEAKKREAQTRRETEHYRQINRKYRERERSAEIQRRWENMYR